ncbi:neutral/alkaline non-lysosomal ceramidase N-terminal domain-containing protein [Myxococcota bacterium]
MEADDLVRLLWRLPFWGPVTAAVRLLGRVNRPDPIPPVPDPAPLDAFMGKAREGFFAGAATCDITPEKPEGMFLGGFDYDRPCAGVRDPIYARVLALSDGTTPLVIVSLDLVGLSLVRTRRIREMLTREHPDSILLVCTHNHQSPDTLGLWGPALFNTLPYRTGLDRGYMAWLEERIVDCVRSALEQARPARLHLASGEFDKNDRWIHNERTKTRDRTVRVIHLADESGAAIATLIQHACHPETLWKSNRLISADFCGVCCRRVENQVGGVALYANGALGAMVTAALDWEAPPDRREEFFQKLGNALGDAALRLVDRAKKKETENPAIEVKRNPVRFRAKDNRLFGLVHALGVVESREFEEDLVSEVSFARLGPASITALPGEAAPALGLEMLKRVPGSPKLLFCLCNDELGYLLPPEFFSDPAYAYESGMGPGPQAATRLALAVEESVR